MLTIRDVRALEILDSRGNPTLSVTVELSDGTQATAQVPSGASTGKHEAVELRDGDPNRYRGKGVLRAVANVNEVLRPAVAGMSAEDQAGLDRRLIECDGTRDKSRLGANAILGVSCAVARAVAVAKRVSLWRHLASIGGTEVAPLERRGQTTKNDGLPHAGTGAQAKARATQGYRSADFGAQERARIPVPMVNIISGGLHAGGRFEVQDFMVVPRGFASLAEALEAIVKVHRVTEGVLRERGYELTGVADEGGWGPALESNEAGLAILTGAIARTGLQDRFTIALDVAATHFHRDGRYHLNSENRVLNCGEMIDMLAEWVSKYPITSIEDGLEEDDWEGWPALTERLGPRVQLIGDDLFTTDPDRLRHGIGIGAANAVLVKMNQIGTLSETFEVIRLARAAGYGAVISARSGETEDSFLADLAVASGAGQIKIGSVTKSERLAKYNRLLEIEAELAKTDSR